MWQTRLPGTADPVGVAYAALSQTFFVADSSSASIFAYGASGGS